MTTTKKIWRIWLYAILLSAATAMIYPGTHLFTAQEKTSQTAAQAISSLPDFVTLAKKVEPSVVNISTVGPRRATPPAPSPFGEQDPFEEFWRRFFGQPTPPGPQRGLGSGFIIDSDGLILTNNHVIENAEKIIVRLADKSEHTAKIIGRDSKTDVALIRIEIGRKLTPISLGDSVSLQVGEWVAAFGNPFGLDRTVTAGIVSAKGRHIGAGPYDDFIQTDASINPGNSGGPLVNLRGEVVGINTAIFTRTGGFIGIGFAIPIDLVKSILPELKDKGRVTRGWLGVAIQPITAAIAESLQLPEPRGALVSTVTEGGPAERAGIQVGDVIVNFDGKPIKEPGELPLVVAQTPVGRKVDVAVVRAGKEVKLTVTIGELKDDAVAVAPGDPPEKAAFGLAVQPVTPAVAGSLGLDRPQGVIVTTVEAGSAAEDAGLQRGDVILEINRNPVTDVNDFRKKLADAKEKSLLLLIRRGQSNMFLALSRSG